MSDLYNKVKQIIEANSFYDAEQLLYGKEGIQINRTEYYQNIIANFIKKKETIIKKVNGKLFFDLNNYNDIWNIIFIA